MDCALACCTGGAGSIPAVGKIQMFYLGKWKKMEPDMIICMIQRIHEVVIMLATPSMGQNNGVSARTG